MAKNYQFPSYYDMPPMFTLQPVLNTRKKQLQLWTDIIVEFSKFYKKFEYSLAEVAKSPLFNNSKINRKCNIDMIKTVFEELASQGYGEWQNKEKTQITIYWKRPEDWGSLIYKWVSDSGKLNSVLTVYEIQQGDDSEGQEFHNLETRVLLKALKYLEKEGKCQVFTGTSDDNLGVKFFSI